MNDWELQAYLLALGGDRNTAIGVIRSKSGCGPTAGAIHLDMLLKYNGKTPPKESFDEVHLQIILDTCERLEAFAGNGKGG